MATRPASIALRDHVDPTWLLRVASAMSDSALHRDPYFLDGPADEDEDEWTTLFQDHNARDAHLGYYRHPDREARSRRLDMRGPTDFDPGPIAMQEPEGDDSSVILRFARRTR